MSVDGAGIVHEGDTGLKRLYEVSSAPIFTYDESFFGPEVVGGPMFSINSVTSKTIDAAIRILSGEQPSAIKTPPIPYELSNFNAKELQRWNISEALLPIGSNILLREPSAWDRYQFEIIGILIALIVQTLLIGSLLWERRRRHLAESSARHAMSELAYMDKISTAGQLAASIAHEVTQPLAGIVARAGAARRWLTKRSPTSRRRAIHSHR